MYFGWNTATHSYQTLCDREINFYYVKLLKFLGFIVTVAKSILTYQMISPYQEKQGLLQAPGDS